MVGLCIGEKWVGVRKTILYPVKRYYAGLQAMNTQINDWEILHNYQYSIMLLGFVRNSYMVFVTLSTTLRRGFRDFITSIR